MLNISSSVDLTPEAVATRPRVELREYQVTCLARVRAAIRDGHRAVLLQLPTGGGKTVIFANIAASAFAKRKQVLVVVHRRELYRQAARKLVDAGVTPGIIAAGVPGEPDRLVQVGSVQTLIRRLDTLPAFDVVVLDEAHHARAGQWQQLLASQPQAIIVGVTATPARLDGKGLGKQDGGLFDALIVGPSISELVGLGYLSPTKCFVPDHKLDLRGVHVKGGDYASGELDRWMQDSGATITGDAIGQYRRRVDGGAAIAFCVSVRHAQDVAAHFTEAGYRAVCVHGGTPKEDRDAAIAGLGTGEVQVLTSCDLISEGLGVPAVSAVILLRPTKSLVLYMQQVGRGMRPAPGKEALSVLDHVGNVLEHGLPCSEHIWSLDGVKKKRRAGREPTWKCECGCLNPLSNECCTACGAERPGQKRVIQQVDGDLAEITRETPLSVDRLPYWKFQSQIRSKDEIRAYRIARRYNPGWEWHFQRAQAERLAASGRTPA
jgi:DNA repair protein RadD